MLVAGEAGRKVKAPLLSKKKRHEWGTFYSGVKTRK